jgi:hypothetical protein
MTSEQWLAARAPGFRDLPEEDRKAIMDFAFLWSLFEAKVMENFARAAAIRGKVDEWAIGGTLQADAHEEALRHFATRYFVDGRLTYHFEKLHLRSSDFPELVKSVLSGQSDEPRDRVLALLMIVWRLRNNLFHGMKWAYELRDQRENFRHANATLMRVLEPYVPA